MLKLVSGGRPLLRPTGCMRLLAALAVAALIWSAPGGLIAQMPEATRLEMRHFWHVFIAYAVAWVILFAWILAILRRVRRVEEKLG